ncbi:MAG TPA: hypothetical protein PLN23_08855 [Fervidobacterium sp.]|nr:hypothetical protein [Fervidobacterium sp.]
MIYLDMYDEESKCYTPHNFLDFCGFECRYNELTERYDVNGLASSTLFITSFEEEEFAVTVTRFLITLKAITEINPQSEVRFIDVDMIIDELEEMEEDDEVLFTDETEEKIEEIAYCNVAYKFICIFIGFVIGVLLMGVFQ